ncbi:hypothetical protein KUCAC02_030434, partial [Chaenocephalus aceratus]
PSEKQNLKPLGILSEEERGGGILSERSFVRSADFHRRSTTDKRALQSCVTRLYTPAMAS